MVDKWDVFICHASEDKKEVVEPLASQLKKRDLRVWYDRWVLTIGDSLRRNIDEGLRKSRYGIVILSPHFFNKEWPQIELDGLVQREIKGTKVILPVWHNVTYDEVVSFSPTLADKMAGSTKDVIEKLADELFKAISESNPKNAIKTPSLLPNKEISATIDISFENVSINGHLHIYSLTVEITLKVPPDQGRFRLELLWPKSVRITELKNLRQGSKKQIDGFDFREIWLDCDRRIFPGQTMKIVGKGAITQLEYMYDNSVWSTMNNNPRNLYYTLFLEDHLPVKGEKPFKELNKF